MRHDPAARRPPSVIALAAFILLGAASASQAEPYKLVPEDKIRLRLVEWQPVQGQYASWEALDGTYLIDDAGNASIPLVGEIRAEGRTTNEFSAAVIAALNANGGAVSKPFVSVEIAEHAPIYVVGNVRTPGKYPFNVDMTVMKAVSLAGGFERASDDRTAGFERDSIQAAGAFRTAGLDRRDLLMRAARLRAEIDGQGTFDMPAELEKVDGAQALLANERNLLRLRRVELENQIAAAEDLGRLYAQEIQTLEAKIVSQNREISLAKKEFAAGQSLASKGLTVNSRQFSLERSVADAEGELLDFEIALTRSRQALAENARDKDRFANVRNAENQKELNEVNLALRKAELDMQVAELLGNQAGYQTRRLQFEESGLGNRAEPTYEIVRRTPEGVDSSIQASETTDLRPHDLLKIGTSLTGGTGTVDARPADAQLKYTSQPASGGY